MNARSRIPLPSGASLRWTLLVPLAFAVLVIPFVVELILEVHPDFALAPNVLSTPAPMHIPISFIATFPSECAMAASSTGPTYA